MNCTSKNFTVRYGVTVFCLFILTGLKAATDTQIAAIERLRGQFSQSTHTYTQDACNEIFSLVALLGNDGRFADFKSDDDRFVVQKSATDNFNFHVQLTAHGVKAWERIRKIAEYYKGNKTVSLSNDTIQRILKAVVWYGTLEHDRNPLGGGRFHGSCFAIPRDASKVYFSLFRWMDAVEKGELKDSSVKQAQEYLQKVAFQSWTQPMRRDVTDNQVVSVDRFRGHVWWVGGNALDYRPLFESALMMRSSQMIDVLHEVCMRSFSSVSQTTYDTSFWIEGMTADGAGWGHGKQCLVWGYPIDGMIGAFRMLSYLQHTPWDTRLSAQALETIMNYIRGSSFYHHKGVIPPILDRNNMTKRTNVRGRIPATRIAETLLSQWKEDLPPSISDELTRYIAESNALDVNMSGYPIGQYSGARYFYNNDDLIKKTPDYYLFVNMGSFRVDGLESAYPGCTGYNFYTNDGVTLFQRDGMEYRRMMGAIDLNALPGTTLRHSPDTLCPIVHWGGYTSKYDFAAGAPSSAGDFAAGFISLKIDTRQKELCDTMGLKDKNSIIFGVKSHKAYFMFGDQLLALGAGIVNYKPDTKGDIVTTVEQTYSPHPFFSDNKKTEWGQQLINGDKPTPITHAGFIYTVLPRYTTGSVQVTRENRHTRWGKLCPVNKEAEEDVPVFQMQINHGQQPKNGTYAYVVDCKPSISKKQTFPIVLSNTTALQAAENSSGSKLGAIVYDPAIKIKSKLGHFKLSHPAALLISRKDNTVEITVTDAYMNRSLHTLIVETTLPVYGDNVVARNGKRYISIDMPKEPHRGAPAQVQLRVSGW